MMLANKKGRERRKNKHLLSGNSFGMDTRSKVSISPIVGVYGAKICSMGED